MNVLDFSRENRTSKMEMHKKKRKRGGRGERLKVKELAHTIVKADKAKMCRVGWRCRKEYTLQFKSKESVEAELPASWGKSVFSIKAFKGLNKTLPHYGG